MKNFEAFTRMERATALSHPQNGLFEEFRDTHLLEIRNLSENATKFSGIIFLNQNNLTQK